MKRWVTRDTENGYVIWVCNKEPAMWDNGSYYSVEGYLKHIEQYFIKPLLGFTLEMGQIKEIEIKEVQ